MSEPRRSRGWFAPGLGLCLGSVTAAIAVTACAGARESDVAELVSILSGSAERSEQGTTWQPSHAGDRFRAGDGVRTSEAGGARLHLLAGGSLRMGPSTTIRFGAGQLAVDGELEAEHEDVLVELVLGRAHIAAGSRVRIGRRGDQVRFDVLVGSAVIDRADEELGATAGETLHVDVTRAKVERVAAAGAAPSAPVVAATTPRVVGRGRAGAGDGAVDPGRTGPGPIVGELLGSGARMRRGNGVEWTALPAGRHELSAGTEIGLARGGRLSLSRDQERAVVVGAAELVVAPGGPAGPLIDARRGRAELWATAADVSVRVPGGRIVARRAPERGSGADLRIDGDATSVLVTSGVVDMAGDQGGEERLLTGQSGVVEPGGGLQVFGRPPARADFSIDAGLSASIHDPSPPTDVRIRFAALCPDLGVIELAEGDSFRAARIMVQGRGAAIARLGRGGHRYRVRCFEGHAIGEAVVANGRLRIERDSGTRPLARLAPHNTVDADGRHYIVLYQNRLPSITFRWPGAPESDRYRLVVAPRQGPSIDVFSPTADRTMESGELAEGRYRFWFAAPELGRESRPSSLTIDFDNAASSGYLQFPRPAADWDGPSVMVSGAAIEGWRVTVSDTPLSLDRQHRFSALVARADDENGIAVAFAHPTHGVHLYVRRPAK